MIFAQTAAGWETYGPLGLILASLLGAFGYLYKDKVARERELDTRHTTERSEWRESCKAERTEIMELHRNAWEESRADLKQVLGENSRAVNALESAVRDLHVDVKARRMRDLQDEARDGETRQQ